ncbi:MAG: DNA topoisomerase IB [Actinomycetota bacterium]
MPTLSPQSTSRREATRPSAPQRRSRVECISFPDETLHPDGRTVAAAAGLRYVSDEKPGITRKRAGRHFSYLGMDGRPIRDERTLQRIRSLAIPPAWTNVWICPSPNGHIQATGRDTRGRKQYRYHPRWRAVRDETKYDRMLVFAQALPGIRERINADLRRPGLPRERVLATVIRLLESTLIRVGNEEYARQNQSYGLTTLLNEHVDVEGTALHFHFRGKSGKEFQINLRDRRLARIVQRCQALPGQDLFGYLDADGEPHTINSGDVNTYLREISGQDFTAKDFRTWAGTLLAFQHLRELSQPDHSLPLKKDLAETVRQVAARLGNTPAVCRKCYIHPAVLEAFQDPEALPLLECAPESEHAGLPEQEAALLAFLAKRLPAP